MTILANIMDMNIVRILGISLALIVGATTVEMIRRRKLREEYALLWMGTSAVLLAFAVFPQFVLWISEEMHVTYMTTIVMAMFLFLAMIVMHFAMAISRQAEEIRQLAQRLAILNEKLEPPATPHPQSLMPRKTPRRAQTVRHNTKNDSRHRHG